jgi:hypothetical protein
MQLLNGSSRGGSVVFELAVSAALIVGVGASVYALQHPHLSQAQQITAAFQQ